MHRAPAGASLRLALERCIAGAHERLPYVVETVRGVVGDFLCEVDAAVALLEMLHEI